MPCTFLADVFLETADRRTRQLTENSVDGSIVVTKTMQCFRHMPSVRNRHLVFRRHADRRRGRRGARQSHLARLARGLRIEATVGGDADWLTDWFGWGADALDASF